MRLNDGLHAGDSLVRNAVRVLRFRREILAACLCDALLEACDARFGRRVALHAHDADGRDLVPALVLRGLDRSLAAHRGEFLVVEADKAEHLVRIDRGVDRHNRQVSTGNLCCNGLRLERRHDHGVAVARAERGFDHGELLVIRGFRARTQNIDRDAQIFAGLLTAVADILPVLGRERFQNDLDMVILICRLPGAVIAARLRSAAAAACKCAHQHRTGNQCGK